MSNEHYTPTSEEADAKCVKTINLQMNGFSVTSAVQTLQAHVHQRVQEAREEDKRKIEELELALITVLPMAKGYASANPVGNNWKMIEQAAAIVTPPTKEADL